MPVLLGIHTLYSFTLDINITVSTYLVWGNMSIFAILFIEYFPLSRHHYVFHIYDEKKIPISLNNKTLSLKELLDLPLESAKIALAQTRECIGKEKTLKQFKPEIDRGDQM